MFLDVPQAILEVAQPLDGVVPAKLLDEVGGIPGHLLGKLDGINPPQDDVVSLHWIRTRKWRTVTKEQEKLNGIDMYTKVLAERVTLDVPSKLQVRNKRNGGR